MQETQYFIAADGKLRATANRLLKKRGVDMEFGRLLILAKKGKKIRGAISLYPDFEKMQAVVVGPVFAETPIILLRLGELMEAQLTSRGISTYYMIADAKDVKLAETFKKLGLSFVGKDENGDSWFRRTLTNESIH